MSEYVAELSETVYTANVNEPHIVIADDRSVLVPDELKEIAVQFDHNIETVTFDCPRYWDEHDLSKMHIFINYKCANGRLDGYPAENVEVDADDESIIHFTWTLKENITCANGKICFLVCAKKSNEEGVLQNRWNSKPCNDCYVVEGLDVDVSEEIEQSLDLVEQILLHLDTSAAEAHACAKRAEVAAEEARSAADNAVSSVKENFDVIRDEKITEIASATGVEIANVETAASEATAEAEAQIEAKGAAVLATIPEEYTETYQRALRNESRISRNEKRLDNIEKGIMPEKYMEDNTVAYRKSVPVDAGPFVAINKVGGMTRKCSNLLPLDNRSRDVNGVTVSVQGGVVTVNGTANKSGGRTSAISTVFKLRAGTYTFSCTQEYYQLTPYLNQYSDTSVYYLGSKRGTSFNLQEDTSVFLGINVEAGVTYDGSFSLMVNSGDIALPYEPYFEGLRSAPVTEVESVGANLFDMSKLSTSDFDNATVTITEDAISFTTYSHTNNVKCRKTLRKLIPSLRVGDVCVLSAVSTSSRKRLYFKGVTEWYFGSSMTMTDALLDSEIGFYADDVSSAATVSNIRFNRGTTALPYTPYRRNTLPIPGAVQALDGYGWGVSDTVYNYIDWERKQFVKWVEKLVVTELDNLTQWTNGDTFLGVCLDGIDYDYSNGLDIRGVCNHYDVGVGGSFGVNSVRFRQQGDTARWYFYDSALTSLIAWKARISELSASGNPLTVYYKLAEPVITDISDLLTEDNYIPVEGGGTVTMANEYGYAVPSEITYALKEAE